MRILTTFLVAASSLAVATCTSASNVATTYPTASDVRRDIRDLRQSDSENARYLIGLKLADDLKQISRVHGVDRLDDGVIDELISLLDSDDDLIRKYAASGLIYFGTRARQAVPALKKALDRVTQEKIDSPNVVQVGQDSTIVVMNALQVVQGLPILQPDAQPEPHVQ